MTEAVEPRRLFTFASGGWVVLVAGILLVALLVWALWAPITRAHERPPGDGADPSSYGFDLGNLARDAADLDTAMLHREMVPTLDTPTVITVEDLAAGRTTRSKFLVAGDRVVGVSIGGESRVYPIELLTVHEVVHDTLGDVPIAVTYCWLGDTTTVFDRRVGDDTVEFGHSGLVYDCNTLLFDRRDDMTGESLWLQMTGEAIAGPGVGTRLRRIPHDLTRWKTWVDEHPDTTIVDLDPNLSKRYKKASPAQYFASEQIPYAVTPLPNDGTEPKQRVVAVEIGDDCRVYTHRSLRLAASHTDGVWRDTIGATTVVFEPDLADVSDTIRVRFEPPGADAHVTHAFWFAWHALHADVELTHPE